MTESWIAHIEAGRAQPSAKVFREMVRALGVPRESLLMQEDRAA